jgi:hypothetical protein
VRTHKPSPALIVAVLALVVALGGTAMAAGRYVITNTNQIKPNVLKTLTPTPAGHYQSVLTSPTTIAPGSTMEIVRAECLKGEHLISGGYDAELAPGAYVELNAPSENAWLVQVNAARSSAPSSVQAKVLCAPGAVPVKSVTVKPITTG